MQVVFPNPDFKKQFLLHFLWCKSNLHTKVLFDVGKLSPEVQRPEVISLKENRSFVQNRSERNYFMVTFTFQRINIIVEINKKNSNVTGIWIVECVLELAKLFCCLIVWRSSYTAKGGVFKWKISGAVIWYLLIDNFHMKL